MGLAQSLHDSYPYEDTAQLAFFGLGPVVSFTLLALHSDLWTALKFILHLPRFIIMLIVIVEFLLYYGFVTEAKSPVAVQGESRFTEGGLRFWPENVTS